MTAQWSDIFFEKPWLASVIFIVLFALLVALRVFVASVQKASERLVSVGDSAGTDKSLSRRAVWITALGCVAGGGALYGLFGWDEFAVRRSFVEFCAGLLILGCLCVDLEIGANTLYSHLFAKQGSGVEGHVSIPRRLAYTQAMLRYMSQCALLLAAFALTGSMWFAGGAIFLAITACRFLIGAHFQPAPKPVT